VTHFDTAEVYTAKAEDGSTIYNETVVGKAIASINKRDQIQIATKYYPAIHGDEMTPDMVVEACRASCQRLGVSFYQHTRTHTHTLSHKQLPDAFRALFY
jgi:aryl-alcohol dehydrogenase-like predicted oxidoreductase